MRCFVFLLVALALFSHVLDASRTLTLVQQVSEVSEISEVSRADVSEQVPQHIYGKNGRNIHNNGREAAVRREAAALKRMQLKTVEQNNLLTLDQVDSSSFVSTVFSWVCSVVLFFVSYIGSTIVGIPVTIFKVLISIPTFGFLCLYNPVAAVGMVLHGVYSLLVNIFLSPLYLAMVAIAAAGASVDFPIMHFMPSTVQFVVLEPVKSFLYVSLLFPKGLLYGASLAVHFYASAPLSADSFSVATSLDHMISGVDHIRMYVFPEELYGTMMEYTIVQKFASGMESVGEMIQEMPVNRWEAALYVFSFLLRNFVPFGDKLYFVLENGYYMYVSFGEKMHVAKEQVVQAAAVAKEQVVQAAAVAKEQVVQAAAVAKEQVVQTAENAKDAAYEAGKIPTTEETYKEPIKNFLATQSKPVLLENIEIPVEHKPSKFVPYNFINAKLNPPTQQPEVFRPFQILEQHAALFQNRGTSTAFPYPQKAN